MTKSKLYHVPHGKPQVRQLTRGLAQRFATMKECVGERPLKQKILKMLMEDSRKTLIMPFMWSFAVVNGEEYRLDGHHSSSYFYENPESIPDGAYAVVTEYEAKDLKELGELYTMFNAVESGRTCRDINRALTEPNKKLKEVGLDVRSTVITALAAEDNKRSERARTRAELINHPDNTRFAEFVGSLQQQNPEDYAERFRKGAVVQGILRTFRLYPHPRPKHVEEFWLDVLNGRDSRPASPTRKLGKLMSKAGQNVSSTVTAREVVSPHKMLYYIHVTWNAYMEGAATWPRKIEKNYLPEDKNHPPLIK